MSTAQGSNYVARGYGVSDGRVAQRDSFDGPPRPCLESCVPVNSERIGDRGTKPHSFFAETIGVCCLQGYIDVS
jgi:hypothetical protein